MRARAALLALLVALAPTRSAIACGSCRGPGGPGAAWTAPWERAAVVLSQSSRIAHGSFASDGSYRALGADRDRVLSHTLALAIRPIERLELAATATYGSALLTAPGFSASRRSWGDSTLRARYEVVREPALDLPRAPSHPSLAVAPSLRLPTGAVDPVQSAPGVAAGTVGSSATNMGLGAWEVGVAADVRRTFGARRWQASVVAELAVRAPDDALGRERQLGPRAAGRLVLLRFLDPFTASVFVDVAGETDVAYEGRRARGSAQRTAGVGVAVGFKSELGLRSGMSLIAQPPLAGLGQNAVAATAVSAFVGFAR